MLCGRAIGIKSLIHPGLFTAHDIWHQVARLYYYYQALGNGQIPPYWISSLSNGLGYPLFIFSYHLPWIIGSFLLFIGIDIPTALKILFILSYLASGIFMYLFIFAVTKNKFAGTLSALLYLWAPYHFLVILVNASMGFAFVFSFLPLLLLGIYLIGQSQLKTLGIIVTTVGFSGIILSHLISLFLLLPLISAFSFWIILNSQNKYIILKHVIFSLFLGIIISAFYLLPSIYYSDSIRMSQSSDIKELYTKNLLDFRQIIYSKWGYGIIQNNAQEGSLSFQLGIAQWLVIIITMIMLITNQVKEKRFLCSILLLVFILNIFMMLEKSRPFCDLIQRAITIDYPFRLLLPAVFISSALSGIIIIQIKNNKIRFVLFIALVLIALYSNRNHINVNQYTNISVETYIASEITTNTFHEYLPKNADPLLLYRPVPIIDSPNSTYTDLYQNSNKLSLTLDIPHDQYISVKQLAFPGQVLYIDGNRTNYIMDKQGKISFFINKGRHHILIQFEDTPVIKIGKFLTIIGTIILVFFILKCLGKIYHFRINRV